MRLINITRKDHMFFEEFYDGQIPSYAILSHTWEKEELSFSEASNLFLTYNSSSKHPNPAYEKVRGFAEVARGARCGHIWVDTCR